MIALASPAPTSLASLAKTFLLYSRVRLFWSPLFDSNHYHFSDLLSAFVLHHSQLIHENRCHLILYAPVSHILPIDIINNAKWCYMTLLMMDVLKYTKPRQPSLWNRCHDPYYEGKRRLSLDTNLHYIHYITSSIALRKILHKGR